MTYREKGKERKGALPGNLTKSEGSAIHRIIYANRFIDDVAQVCSEAVLTETDTQTKTRCDAGKSATRPKLAVRQSRPHPDCSAALAKQRRPGKPETPLFAFYARRRLTRKTACRCRWAPASGRDRSASRAGRSRYAAPPWRERPRERSGWPFPARLPEQRSPCGGHRAR